MKDFISHDYLKKGNIRQRAALHILTHYRILQTLKPYTPVLTGTIPIEIDLPDSDLDIACFWENKAGFIQVLNKEFSHYKRFALRETKKRGYETVIAEFRIENQLIEIFGQNRPVQEQESYRHMITEYTILKDRGSAFRKKILALKKQGIKTEPAFARALNLDGDPYEALLTYQTDSQL